MSGTKKGAGGKPQPYSRDGKYGTNETDLHQKEQQRRTLESKYESESARTYEAPPEREVSKTYRVDNYNADYSVVQKQLANSTSEYRRKLSKFNPGENATYNLNTGEVVNLTSGYAVSFFTTKDNYTDAEFNSIVEELKELTKSNVYAGCYGRPEISFVCESRKTARAIRQRFHQESYYDVVNDKCRYNPNDDDVEKNNPQFKE